MNSLVSISFFSCAIMVFVLGCNYKNDNEPTNNVNAIIEQLPSAWVESPHAFTNVAHKVHMRICEIKNPTNRFEYVKAYAEVLLRLDKFVRECDDEGFWARFKVVSELVEAMPCKMPLELEYKWEILVRQWLQVKEELVHYASFGPTLPGIIFSGVVMDEKRRKKILEKIDYANTKRRQFDRQHEMATNIRGWLRGQYNFIFERKLKSDCASLSIKRKEALMRMIVEAIGKTPKWYREELERESGADKR